MAGPLIPYAAVPTAQGFAPPDNMGPRCLSISFSVTTGAPVEFDLTKEIESGQIDNIQAMFVDFSNQGGAGHLAITFSNTNYSIVVGGNTQGVYPVFGKALGPIIIQNLAGGTVSGTLIFVNVPMPLVQWQA